MVRAGRNGDINWSEIRKKYIQGKIVRREDGTVYTEDYTYKELAAEYEIDVNWLKQKGAKEKWRSYREAYLAKLDEINLGEDLGLYSTAEYLAEVNTINACQKLTAILDTFLEAKFGDILDLSEVPNKTFSEEDIETISKGVSLTELKDAVRIVTDIYKIQKEIVSNQQKREIDKPTMTELSDEERQQKIAKLTTMLGLIKNE